MNAIDSTRPDDSLEENNFTPLEDEEIITEMIRCMASRPEAVSVTARAGEDNQKILRIETDPADLGQVIGKNGSMIKCLRFFLGAIGARQGHFIMIELVGKDGVPQAPLPPYSLQEFENSKGPSLGPKVFALMEALRDAIDAEGNQSRSDYRPRSQKGYGPPRHLRTRSSGD